MPTSKGSARSGMIFIVPCVAPQSIPQLGRTVEFEDEISAEEINAAGPDVREQLLSTGQWREAPARRRFARTLGGKQT